MTKSRRNSKLERTYEQAALWMIRRQEGELSAAEERSFERWLKVAGHREAMQRMERFSSRLDRFRGRGG